MLEHEIHELDWSGECDDGWAARCYCGWRVVRASEFDAEAQVDAHIALAECTSRDCQFVHDHSRPATPEDVYRAAAEAWVIAHRFEPPLDDLGLRHFTRKAMGQPDLRAAVDAAYAAGREARDAGPCMDSSPRFFGCTPLLCELRAGHTGGHECGTTRWTKADDVERARSERDAYEAGEAAGREAAAQAIQDHADRHAPRDTGGAFRRHLLAAARIALGPLSREEAAKAFSAAVAKLKDDTDG